MTLCQPVKQSLISRASLIKPQHSGFTLVLKIFKESEFRTAWGNEFHNFGAEHENEPLYRAIQCKYESDVYIKSMLSAINRSSYK